MGILCVIPGFLFTEDDFLAKYASGKKILKNRHVKKLVQKRHHKFDDRKKGDKKLPSSIFKYAPGSVVRGYANYCRIPDGKHSVGGSYPRAKTKEVWQKKLAEELMEEENQNE